jgi:hypothetical protein
MLIYSNLHRNTLIVNCFIVLMTKVFILEQKRNPVACTGQIQ